MYLDFFGLSRFPFTIAPDPEFLFPSPGHQEALAHLHYAFTGHGGLICLTGEVGTGKTTLCRAFLAMAPDDVCTAYIFNPQLSALELLQNLCDELGVEYARDASQKDIYATLNKALLDIYAAGKRVICVIDEAQSMPIPLLEQIRLLTNLETDKEKLLTLVLVGQPELRDLLNRYELRQLSQRITARYHLRHLSEVETRNYLRHRLATAGCEQPVFPDSAAKVIWKGCAGVPRIINSVADRALLGAYASNSKEVTPVIARQALREVLGEAALHTTHLPNAQTNPLRSAIGVASGMVMALALVGIGVLLAPRLTGSDHYASADLVEAAAESAEAAKPTEINPALSASIATVSIASAPENTHESAPEPSTPDDLAAEDAQMANADAVKVAPATVLVDVNATDPALMLSPVLGLTAVGCDDLPKQGWACLWVDWPRARLQDFQYQVAVQNEAGNWLPFSQASDEPLASKALLLWQPPQGYKGLVRPGQTSLVVAWVRAVLGVEWHGDWQMIGPSGGQDVLAKIDENFYDPLLALRVGQFQAEQGLGADKILGPQTLLYLQKALAARSNTQAGE
ncbi:ExeA family protein [Parathalassolituus penaei]|uniref:AAA family ATPase n=1 Tax=Parathalassolituus penaei TaxID=2997323 RepID=A0A9X3EL97_9GAMM|nr:AAA family ATPase [Parathalassolituus penaei]MCY0966436.1 AAA family ATPase [Parathalassolituus penaei]